MEEQKWYTSIIRIPQTVLHKIDYFFTKRWLDRTFGVREYWGDEIFTLLNNQKQ